MSDVVAPRPPADDDPGAPSAAGDSRSAAPQRPPIENVWSHAQPKYRVRAVTLLLVNLVLFCVLCVFMHWLHVGRAFDLSLSSYTAPLRFWGEQTQNLNDFVLYPVSVEQNPMHGVVLGLLVASIVAVPISVAILYRFPYALPFVGAVLIFAHMPWMALTQVGCCLLAAVKPFRLSFRFGAALVGMLPVILYLYLATRGTPDQITTYASPDQKLLLAAPWVLAIIAACVMLGVILLISRLVNYRPGAVGPVMAVMFVTPLLLFHSYVGFDEVSYRVLETEFGPRSPRFMAQDVTDRVRDLIKTRLDEAARQELVGIIAGRPDSLAALNRQVTHWLLRDLLTDRRTAYEECREFIADHPDSRYVPNVLYIQGWVLDLRLGAPRALAGGSSIRRELYSDYPHVQSEEIWRSLLKSYPDSPLAIVAGLRVAQLRLRRGEADEAIALLDSLQPSEPEPAATQSATQPVGYPRSRNGPESSLGFSPEPYWREARRLRELIRANSADPRYGTVPLAELAQLDPQRPGYRAQLERLAQRYRGAVLYDNLVVLWAAGLADRDERAAALEACIRDFPNGDAIGEAMFRLAELEIQSRGEDQEARRQQGTARMNEVAQRFGQTHWGREAAERLRLLTPPVEPQPEGEVMP